MPDFVAAVLCGGSGARLWPLSRQDCPKPFVSLPGGGQSLLAQTYRRIAAAPQPPRAVITVAAGRHVFLCEQIFRSSGGRPPHRIIGEPLMRNTAAAVVAAAEWTKNLYGEDAVLAILPADHFIADDAAFWRAMQTATNAAQDGYLALLGIAPVDAACGYGYIERGEKLRHGFAVRRFVEKPPPELARQFIEQGNYDWNAGIFCLTPKTLFSLLPHLAPQFVSPLRRLNKPATDAAIWRPQENFYAEFPDISFDYAILEKTDRAAVAPADELQWSDMGSWTAVGDTLPIDENGNRAGGDSLLLDCHNCVIIGAQRLIAAVDVRDLHIIDTRDALLIASAKSAQRTREIFQKLRNRPQAETSPTVHRPWGNYTVLAEGDGHKVKRIEVLPGGVLSLQSHRHRSEQWTAVSGEMGVVIGDQTLTLAAGDSCRIPQGAKHRMRNDTDSPAAVIEVQTGDYLGEDDIVRYEDIYGRATKDA